jgi:flagellar assembly factor FliW
MQIETTRFGTIEVKDGSIVRMPVGMLGFEQCCQFVLLEDRPGSALRWLQSVDDPAVAFIVINPFEFFPEYEVELTDEQADALGLDDPNESVTFTTVTVSREEGKVTANLLGPIVINSRTLQARQIVLEDDRYCTKHVIVDGAAGAFEADRAKAA